MMTVTKIKQNNKINSDNNKKNKNKDINDDNSKSKQQKSELNE